MIGQHIILGWLGNQWPIRPLIAQCFDFRPREIEATRGPAVLGRGSLFSGAGPTALGVYATHLQYRRWQVNRADPDPMRLRHTVSASTFLFAHAVEKRCTATLHHRGSCYLLVTAVTVISKFAIPRLKWSQRKSMEVAENSAACSGIPGLDFGVFPRRRHRAFGAVTA